MRRVVRPCKGPCPGPVGICIGCIVIVIVIIILWIDGVGGQLETSIITVIHLDIVLCAVSAVGQISIVIHVIQVIQIIQVIVIIVVIQVIIDILLLGQRLGLICIVSRLVIRLGCGYVQVLLIRQATL